MCFIVCVNGVWQLIVSSLGGVGLPQHILRVASGFRVTEVSTHPAPSVTHRHPLAAMGCSGSKTATKAGKKAAPVKEAPKKVEVPKPAETALPAEPAQTEVPAAPVVTEASAPAEAVEEAEAKTADAEKAEEAKVEEAEKAIGDLRESELKLSADKADAKAEDGDTVTTATREDSPRPVDVKIETTEATGPCVCSLW